MTAERTEKSNNTKRWVLIIICILIIILLLTMCGKCCSSDPQSSSLETATESAEPSGEELTSTVGDTTDEELTMTEETGETRKLEDATDHSEDTTDVPEDSSSESEAETYEGETEAVTTKEEATQTLPEETTEEAEATKESSSGKTEPASTSKEKETTKATTAPPETTKATTAPTQPTTPPPTTSAPTQPAHTHSYTGKITKQPTCGATGVKTYTCSGCGHSYTETIPATGNHNWAEQFKTVHHDAQTHVIHHDAETHIVHHDAVTHQQWVVDQPAYDENVTEPHDICNSCGADLTVMYWNNGNDDSVYFEHGNCYMPSWHTEQVVIRVIHHEEKGHYETVVDTPAWDETVIDKPAWDEVIVDKEAWDETVHDCYKCSVCGATKP